MRIGSGRSRALVGALAAVALVSAGCGGSSNKSNSSAGGGSGTTGKEKVTLTIGLFGTFGFKEAGLYKEYTRLHPNVTIKEDDVEQSADYYKALQTHLAASSGLDDVQGIEIGFVADLLKHHADDFVDFAKQPDAGRVKPTFYPWKWQMATSGDGRTIGLGTDAGPEAMCYRKDLFGKAGLPTDRTTLAQQWSTWDGFLQLGKQYEQAANKPSGSHFLDSAASIFSAAVYQGNAAYDDANGNPIVETSDGVKNAWRYASQAAQDKLTAGLQQFSAQWNQAFSNGAFATISCPAWMLGYITSQAGPSVAGKWDVAPIPGGAANWGGSWLGVPTASKHQSEAVQFVEWLTAPQQQVTMWTSQQHFPSSSTAAENPAVASARSSYFSNAPIGQIFGESAGKLQRTPIGPYDTQIQSALTTALTAIETKGQAPDNAWRDALKNIDQVIGG
jgi:cellobiose transport system substrate-binding protein